MFQISRDASLHENGNELFTIISARLIAPSKFFPIEAILSLTGGCDAKKVATKIFVCCTWWIFLHFSDWARQCTLNRLSWNVSVLTSQTNVRELYKEMKKERWGMRTLAIVNIIGKRASTKNNAALLPPLGKLQIWWQVLQTKTAIILRQ